MIHETKRKFTQPRFQGGFPGFLGTRLKFTHNANSHDSKLEIHTKQKLYHFGCYVTRAKLFCEKRFVPVNRAGVESYGKIVIPSYRGFDGKNRDLGNRAGRLLI